MKELNRSNQIQFSCCIVNSKIMKSLYTCALLLAIFCVVHGATKVGWDKAKRKEVADKCIKKTGIQDIPDPGKPNLSQNEKCFISCMLTEGGAMNADGTFTEELISDYTSDVPGRTEENKNKARSVINECTKTGLVEKDMCQHAVTAINCVSEKAKTIKFT